MAIRDRRDAAYLVVPCPQCAVASLADDDGAEAGAACPVCHGVGAILSGATEADAFDLGDLLDFDALEAALLGAGAVVEMVA